MSNNQLGNVLFTIQTTEYFCRGVSTVSCPRDIWCSQNKNIYMLVLRTNKFPTKTISRCIPRKKHSDCFYCSPLNFPALKSYPFESSVHQVWVFRWKAAKKDNLHRNEEMKRNRKKKEERRLLLKGRFARFSADGYYPSAFLPGLALFPWRSTIASRVQFKPIKTGANLVVNSSHSLLRSSTFPGHTAQKLYHEDFCSWAIVAW